MGQGPGCPRAVAPLSSPGPALLPWLRLPHFRQSPPERGTEWKRMPTTHGARQEWCGPLPLGALGEKSVLRPNPLQAVGKCSCSPGSHGPGPVSSTTKGGEHTCPRKTSSPGHILPLICHRLFPYTRLFSPLFGSQV